MVKAASRPVSDARIRYSTAVQRAGLFKDEPEIVSAFVRNRVPLALAMRSFDAYSAAKHESVKRSVEESGFTGKSLEANIMTKEEQAAKAQEHAQKQLEGGLDDGGGFFGFLGDVGTAIGKGFGWAGEQIAGGANAVWQTLTMPLTVGYANETSFDRDLQQANQDIAGIPILSEIAGVGSALAGGVVNFGEGLYRLASGDYTPEQQADIKRSGDRPFNFYFQRLSEKKSPVSDTDVNWLKGLNKHAPEDVDAAREIVTTGALEDLARSMPALSPRAQDLILRVNTDPKASELLGAMADTTQTTIGGRMVRQVAPNAAPDEFLGPGTMSRAITAAVAEVIATWHVDPLVLAAKGYQGVRAGRYAVDLASTAKSDALDHTVQMLKASDDNFAPKGATAKRFDQAMDTVDQMVTAGLNTPEAAKMRQSWIRRYQGYEKTLDTLLGMRTGAIGELRLRTMDEAAKDAKAAAETTTNVRPWVIEATGDGKPLWRYTREDGTKLTAEERALERSKVASELSAFIVADAYASGRELTGSRLLLPGQLSINGKIRDTIAPVLEAFNRRDRSVMKQMKEVGNKPIDLDGHVMSDEVGRWDQLVSPESAEWYRNNYTFGITHSLARNWRAFEKTFSNAVINPADPGSVQTFQRLVSQFMPKRQAQMVSTQYAGANPAERWAMTRQTLGALINTMNMRNTPAAQRIVDQMTKGLVPADSALDDLVTGAKEWYTTPDNNFIRVGDFKMPGAVHPWQVTEGVQLPNWKEMRSLANRNWVYNAVTRTSDSDTANNLVRLWKASKVTTWANMQRQALEGFAFTAWRDPKVYTEYRKARKAVKAAVLTGRVDTNDIKRLVAKTNNLDAKDLATLEKVRKSEPEKFVGTVRDLLAKNGYEPGAAEVLARMGQDVDVAEFWGSLKVNHINTGWLAMMGPMDSLRRWRAERHARKGGEILDTPLERYLDGELVSQMTQAHARQLGNAAESYAWNTAERVHNSNRQLVVDGAGRGISMRPVQVNNAYEWLGAKGDATAGVWSAELGRRLGDQTGKAAAQLLAFQYLARKSAPAGVDDVAPLSKDFLDSYLPDLASQIGDKPGKFKSADDLMAYLYMEHPSGSTMRTNAARMQYLPDGKLAVSEADKMVAAQHAARHAVDDLVHHLGGTVSRVEGSPPRFTFPDEVDDLLRKVAKGDEISADDLAKLPVEVRPEGLAAPLYAPLIPTRQGKFQGLANFAARAYSNVVAKPMENLYSLPAFIAQKRVAYDEVSPLMEAMTKRGVTPEQAAYMVEAMVNNRAIARVFKTTDNPNERTVFSEMADKWLMFHRANEDFLRRLIEATKASPQGIARANILAQAGVHSGIIHSEPYQDENGNTEQQLTFTYPGTALGQRVLADAGQALGLWPDELVRVPQFDGLKSQVRFLNPGISNPVSFSLNPIFGYAISGMEKIWPEATVDLERIKRAFSGGQDFEGTEGPMSLKNMMPSMFSRFVPLMQRGDADGQVQSAMRTAMMYAEAGGLAPGSDASPAERQRFLDNVKATATNILLERAIFGTFAPAAPQLADPQEIEVDMLGRLEGLPNLRSEFFDIRSDLSKKYPDNFMRANQEAVLEFARRYPGELIVNPAAFSVGSTKVEGVEEGFVPYTIEATRWLFANLEFVRANPTVAIALMPKSTADGDFSNEAYKLQLKSDIRTHKDLEQFYNDLTLSDDISGFYKTRSEYFTAARELPQFEKSIYAKMDDWEDGWRRTHPLASQELNRRANPDFTHAEVAPAVERILDGTDPIPSTMADMRPQMQELYDDYQVYRRQFHNVDFFDPDGKAEVNKAYQTQGDQKWLGTPLASLWDLMRVTEGR